MDPPTPIYMCFLGQKRSGKALGRKANAVQQTYVANANRGLVLPETLAAATGPKLLGAAAPAGPEAQAAAVGRLGAERDPVPRPAVPAFAMDAGGVPWVADAVAVVLGLAMAETRGVVGELANRAGIPSVAVAAAVGARGAATLAGVFGRQRAVRPAKAGSAAEAPSVNHRQQTLAPVASEKVGTAGATPVRRDPAAAGASFLVRVLAARALSPRVADAAAILLRRTVPAAVEQVREGAAGAVGTGRAAAAGPEAVTGTTAVVERGAAVLATLAPAVLAVQPRIARLADAAAVVPRHPTVVARSLDAVLASLAGVSGHAAAAPENVVHVRPETLALIAAVLGRGETEAAAIDLDLALTVAGRRVGEFAPVAVEAGDAVADAQRRDLAVAAAAVRIGVLAVEAPGAAVTPAAQRAGGADVDRSPAVAVRGVGEFAAETPAPGVAGAGSVAVDGTEIVAVHHVGKFAAQPGMAGVTRADPVDVDGTEVVALRLPSVLAGRAGKMRFTAARAIGPHDAVAAAATIRV